MQKVGSNDGIFLNLFLKLTLSAITPASYAVDMKIHPAVTVVQMDTVADSIY